MFWSCLPEACHIAGNAEVASHANFLSTAYAHAVNTANNRFLAHKYGRDHVIKQPHILGVFLRVAGIVFGIFLGVATSAKCFVTYGGKNDCHYTAVVGSLTERKYHLFNCTCSIRIVLFRII